MNKYPLLIGGAPRSGTTALLQLLNSSSNAFISSEEDIFATIKALKKTLSTQEKRSETLRVNGMREKSIRETLTEDNIHSHNFTKSAVWPLIKYNYKWHHKRVHPDAELILWGDKLPNYYKNLNSICTSNKFKYLHITRNPLDVINSMLRRTAKAKEGKDWWKAVTSFDDMLNVWVSAYEAILENENNTHVFHLHYEDLVFNFTETHTSINKFLSVDLNYENILVSDRGLHFNRDYLTSELTEKILSNKTVSAYMQSRKLDNNNNFC